MVDRVRFDNRLRSFAIAAGVAFIKARLAGVESDGRGVRLAENGSRPETISFAGTIIDATGRAAAVVRRKGAVVTMRDQIIAELIEETCDEEGKIVPAWLDVEKVDSRTWTYCIEGSGGRTQTWRIRRSGGRWLPERYDELTLRHAFCPRRWARVGLP